VELQAFDREGKDEAGLLFHKFERSRPDLARIVDGVFGSGTEERVAVLVCGPKEMAEELRGEVGRWVSRGRDVWWWDEGFGW